MADNKFIERLKGENAAKSVLEVKNTATKTSFANMPSGTSNAIDIYSDARNDATAVLKGADNWKLNNTTFDLASTLYGDGRDLTSTYTVTGNTTWINAVYTFTDNKIFTPNTKWVLKLCGHSLLSDVANIIDFSLIIKFNNQYIITKSFSVKEQAFDFCQEFVIDFSESEQNTIKMANTDTMTVQLLCADSTASATIYNGMTVLTALQRRTDTDAVASDKNTFKDLEDDIADIQEDIVDIHTELDGKVNIDGSSVMTGPLKMAAGSMRGAFSPYFNGVAFWKMDSQNNITQTATLSDTQFLPATTNATDLGSSTKKWKDLYLAGDEYLDNGKRIRFAGTASNRYFNIETNQDEIRFIHKYGSYNASLSFRAYTGDVVLYPHNDDKAIFGLPTRRWNRVYATHLCSDTNGVNLLTVPNKLGTLATKDEVDLAANSGSQLYTTGVWYAKMYAATVVPTGAEYDGRNYADFSQVDSDNNPVIKIYTSASGAWTLTETITPPANYNGYMTITSKIWDISEQAGQQGGQVLWSYNNKTFTPYPKIVSFENAALTGVSTAPTPTSSSPNNQIATKGYVDSFSGANTDLSNLTSTGKNISNWSSNVSNCITEIPQDIKLELNNGTLTLKAGSKVYVPNGSGVFDVVMIANDITYTYGYGADTLGLYYNPTSGNLEAYRKNSEVSGTTPTNTCTFYNTSTNNISRINNVTVVPKLSFPIATITTNASQITSIDQVFNGFGYIGSTVFALPGVKGLIPDGRNADGSLKNINMNITSVQTIQTAYFNNTNWVGHLVGQNGSIGQVVQNHYFEQPNEPKGITGWTVWFNTNNNIVYLRNIGSGDSDDKWVVAQDLAAFHWTVDSNAKITSFSAKTTFHAVDYSDSKYIANCAMPSDKYINLTLGASGASYTAPTDGYVMWLATTTSTEGYVRCYNKGAPGLGLETFNQNTGYLLSGFIPVNKGNIFIFTYVRVNVSSFRFVYANGAA